MFLGGCTFSEVSALRFLGRERGELNVDVTRDTCLHPPQSSLLLFCRWESSFTSAVLTLNLTDRRRIVFSVLLIELHILNFFSNVFSFSYRLLKNISRFKI